MFTTWGYGSVYRDYPLPQIVQQPRYPRPLPTAPPPPTTTPTGPRGQWVPTAAPLDVAFYLLRLPVVQLVVAPPSTYIPPLNPSPYTESSVSLILQIPLPGVQPIAPPAPLLIGQWQPGIMDPPSPIAIWTQLKLPIITPLIVVPLAAGPLRGQWLPGIMDIARMPEAVIMSILAVIAKGVGPSPAMFPRLGSWQPGTMGPTVLDTSFYAFRLALIPPVPPVIAPPGAPAGFTQHVGLIFDQGL